MKGNEYTIVSIDGVDGSGKTTLAKYIPEQLGCTVIHIDEHVEKEQGGYIEFIRNSEIKGAILKAQEKCHRIFIEGVCVLQILENIHLQPDLKIYIKKLILGNYCVSDNIYREATTLKEKLSQEDKKAHDFAELEGDPIQDGGMALSGLKRDIITYHWRYRPDEKADILFGNKTD